MSKLPVYQAWYLAYSEISCIHKDYWLKNVLSALIAETDLFQKFAGYGS